MIDYAFSMPIDDYLVQKEQGVSDERIAAEKFVSVSTLNAWKRRNGLSGKRKMKLTDKEVNLIRMVYSTNKYTKRELCQYFKISESYASDILLDKSRKRTKLSLSES